jgi:hypothetical protein
VRLSLEDAASHEGYGFVACTLGMVRLYSLRTSCGPGLERLAGLGNEPCLVKISYTNIFSRLLEGRCEGVWCLGFTVTLRVADDTHLCTVRQSERSANGISATP